MPIPAAEMLVKSKIKDIEQELGGPITPGIFFMEMFEQKHGAIKHNAYPLPDLHLHFFMKTPIDMVEFLECNNYQGNESGGCFIRDWGQMSHRERTIGCMVDEETGETICDTIGNLSRGANKFPYRLLRGTTNNEQIVKFLFGQEQLKEMLRLYEKFMED